MPSPSAIDPVLLDFCTPRQKELLQATIKYGSARKAAKAIGVSKTAITAAISRVNRQASRRGYSPEHDNFRAVPETHYLKGTSTLYRYDNDHPEGDIRLQWVKSQADNEMVQIVAEELARSFFEAREPLRPVKPPKTVLPDLLTQYFIADLHLGMYAWAREAGADYDCDIASDLLIRAMQRLMQRTPSSEWAVVAQLGDLLHLDDDTNQTRRSKNALDVDSRYHRVAEVGLRLYRATIDLALQKHRFVKVVNVRGNHDDISALWLGVAIQTAYEKNPRVVVDNSPGPYFYHRWENNLFGYTHGNECKLTDLPEIMAADVPRDFGDTENRHWFTGHIHHRTAGESRICSTESFRTLAARDAWHHAKGYRSGRDMRAIVFHKHWGEDERFRVGVRELLTDKHESLS